MATILIVEDNSIERKIVRSLLEMDPDVTIVEAVDGVAAIELLDTTPIDLVLTDIRMPRMDGLSLLKHIKAKHASLPVIVMTAQGSENIAVETLACGADSYLPKAYLQRYLKTTVDQVLSVVMKNRTAGELHNATVSRRLEYRLKSRCSWIPGLVNELCMMSVHSGICPPEDEYRMGVAFEEALRNAVVHGNLAVDSSLREAGTTAYEELIAQRQEDPEYGERIVHILATANGGTIRVSITDEGKGFDVNRLPDPTDPENLLKASGRGVLLMRAFVDSVEYNNVGNQVTLIKRRPEAKPPEADDAEASRDVVPAATKSRESELSGRA